MSYYRPPESGLGEGNGSWGGGVDGAGLSAWHTPAPVLGTSGHDRHSNLPFFFLESNSGIFKSFFLLGSFDPISMLQVISSSV